MDEMTQRFLTNMLIDAQALVEELRKPKPIDWPAEARKAAIAYMASLADAKASIDSVIGASLAAAEALIAEMKCREAFGGQPAPGKEEA